MFSPYIVYTITALLFGLKSANFLYVYCVCSLRSSRSGARPSIGCTRICASNCISVYVFVCKYHLPFTCSSASTSYVLYISMSHSIVVYQYLDPFIRSYSGSVWKFLIDLFSSVVFAFVFMQYSGYTFISGEYAYGLYRM